MATTKKKSASTVAPAATMAVPTVGDKAALKILGALSGVETVLDVISPTVVRVAGKASTLVTEFASLAMAPRQRITRMNLSLWASDLRARGLNDEAVAAIIQTESEERRDGTEHSIMSVHGVAHILESLLPVLATSQLNGSMPSGMMDMLMSFFQGVGGVGEVGGGNNDAN